MSGSSGGGTIIDSLIVQLKLDAKDFVSNKDRAKEATAAIAAGVEDIDKAGDKAGKAQAGRDREARTRATQDARETTKAAKQRERELEQIKRDYERNRSAEQKAKDKERADEVRKEKAADRERTLANRQAAKERKESFDTAKEAALGFGAAVAGVLSLELIKNASSGIADLGRAAHNLDLLTAEVAAFGNAIAAEVGGSAEEARGTLGRLSGALVGLRTGTDMQTLPTLLGQLSKYSGQQLTLKGPDGKFLNSEGLLMQFAKAGQHMDPTTYANLVGGMLDQGSINLTEKGPEAVQAAIDDAKKRGVPSDADAKAAAELQKAFVKLEQEVTHVGQELLVAFGPDLIRMLKDLKSYLELVTLKKSWADVQKDRAQHWHEAQVETLVHGGMKPEDAEAKVTANEQAGGAAGSTAPASGGAPDPSSALPDGSDLRQGYDPMRAVKRVLGADPDAAPGWKNALRRFVGLPSGYKPSPANLAPDVEAEVRKDALDSQSALIRITWWRCFARKVAATTRYQPAGAFGPGHAHAGYSKNSRALPTSVNDSNYDWRDKRHEAQPAILSGLGLDKRENGNTQAADAAYNAGPGWIVKGNLERLHTDKFGNSDGITGSQPMFAASGDDSGLPDETRRLHTPDRRQFACANPGAYDCAGYRPTHHNHDNSSSTSHVTISKVEVNTGSA